MHVMLPSFFVVDAAWKNAFVKPMQCLSCPALRCFTAGDASRTPAGCNLVQI